MKNTHITETGRFLLVATAILAGLIAALHMGKVPAALPRLIEEFSLKLSESGLIVSSFSLLSALLGLLIGIVSSQLGMLRAGVSGLLLAAIGSLAGAFCTSWSGLLASRIVEGLGFVLVAITMPGVINATCPARWRALALGVWGAFIPAAMTLALLASPPILTDYGWQGVWLASGLLTLIWACVYGGLFSRAGLPAVIRDLSPGRVRSLLHGPPLAVVLAFVCYSSMFGAFTAYLPTYWETNNVFPARAARLAALAVAGNIAGNILAGYLVGRGVALRRLMLLAMLGASACACLVFSDSMILGLEVAAAIGFTAFGGLLPGAVMASTAVIAVQPDRIPLFVGLIFQGAGIGQVAGPLLLGGAVSWAGDWRVASLVFLVLAVAGTAFATRYRPPSPLSERPD